MKALDFDPSNFRVISEDKQTVKNDYNSLTFVIYHRDFEIAKVTLSSKCTVSDLMTAVRHSVAANKKFPIQKILFLESLDNREVLDYSLQIGKYSLKNYYDGEKLRLVMKEDIENKKEICLSHFVFKRCLGQGASASVFLVRHRGNGRLYALKQI